MVVAAIRTIFAQPDADHVRDQLTVITVVLGKQLPNGELMLHEAKEDLLAFTDVQALADAHDQACGRPVQPNDVPLPS